MGEWKHQDDKGTMHMFKECYSNNFTVELLVTGWI